MKEKLETLSTDDFCEVLKGLEEALRDTARDFSADIIHEAIRRLSIKPRELFNDEAFSV